MWGRRVAWTILSAWGAGDPSSNLGGPISKEKERGFERKKVDVVRSTTSIYYRVSLINEVL